MLYLLLIQCIHRISMRSTKANAMGLAMVLVGFANIFPTLDAVESSTSISVGIYFTDERDSKIDFYQNGGVLYGRLIAVSPADASTFDVANPDPAARATPVLGMIIMRFADFDKTTGVWKNGKVYDPSSGDEYSASLIIKDESVVLTVSALGGFVSETIIFKRVLSSDPRSQGTDEPTLTHLAVKP